MKVSFWLSSIRPSSRNLNIYLSPNLSVSRLVAQKMAVCFNYLLQRVLNSRNFRDSLVGMKKARGSKSSRIALVVANGPSSKDLNWDWVRKFKDERNMDIFLLNYSLLDTNSTNFVDLADYLVLSDPEMHPKSGSSKNLRNWETVKARSNLQLISPSQWHGEFCKENCAQRLCLHFNDFSLEGVTKNISPRRGRGYSSLTAYKALSCAIHFGYKRILVIGFDNSGFKDITLDTDRNLIQLPGHGLGDYSDDWDCTAHYPNGIGDFLYDYSELFLSLRRCFGGYQITNLGLNSEVDAFPKISLDDDFRNIILRN